ncbi:MAG: hypothetical protein U0Q19_18015 [Kineosporiaceae bacterium]
MPWRDTALAVMVAVIWGTNFVVIEAGLADMPPLLFLVIRWRSSPSGARRPLPWTRCC